MTPVWTAERTVSDGLARELIERQFPELAPARVAQLGCGWDNTAFLVNGTWVFRFPRRSIAVELIRAETGVLPVIAPALPLEVPVPCYVGVAEPEFPWPFAGYRWIEGRTACAANLSEAQRAAAAVPLGRFLRALHRLPLELARRSGAPADTLMRLDLPARRPQVEQRLSELHAKGLIDDVQPWMEVAADVPLAWTATERALVHGDLAAAHILVDDRGVAKGIIDWGDVHRGDPAIDLSIMYSFLPPSARAAFVEGYGPIDRDIHRVARFRALHLAVTITLYAADVDDADLLREARTALGYVATDPTDGVGSL